MNKMFRFKVGDSEVNVIAQTETEARKKAKLKEDTVFIEAFTLNDDWHD